MGLSGSTIRTEGTLFCGVRGHSAEEKKDEEEDICRHGGTACGVLRWS